MIRDARNAIRDTRYVICDAGCGMRDAGAMKAIGAINAMRDTRYAIRDVGCGMPEMQDARFRLQVRCSGIDLLRFG